MAERRSTMMHPSIEDLLAQVDSKFTLVTLAAKRARQINSYFSQLGDGLGALVPPQVASVARKPLSIALEEVAAAKIGYLRTAEAEDGELGGEGGVLTGPGATGGAGLAVLEEAAVAELADVAQLADMAEVLPVAEGVGPAGQVTELGVDARVAEADQPPEEAEVADEVDAATEPDGTAQPGATAAEAGAGEP